MQTVQPKQAASKRCKIKVYAIPLAINISSIYIKSWLVGNRFSLFSKTCFVTFYGLRVLDRCNSS